MPRPIYIIASQSFSIDMNSKLLSIFHILEGLEVTHNPDPPEGTPIAIQTLPLAINAVWMRLEDDDPECEFEYSLVIRPPGGEDAVLSAGVFTFSKPYYRFSVLLQHGPGPDFIANGIMTIESKIRRAGESGWMSQDYPLPITVRVLDGNQGDDSPAGAT